MEHVPCPTWPGRISPTNRPPPPLRERLELLQPSVGHAFTLAADALGELIVKLEEDQALRHSLGMFSDRDFEREFRTTSPMSLRRRRDQVERARRLLRDLELLQRNRDRGWSSRPEHAVEAPVLPAATPRHVMARMAPRARRAADPLASEVQLIDVARRVQDPDGTIRATDVARLLQESEPFRYASDRSAYSAVYDHLRRSAAFDRIAPGQFRAARSGRGRRGWRTRGRRDDRQLASIAAQLQPETERAAW